MIADTKRGPENKVVDAPDRREVVRWMCGHVLTARRALRVISMSASSLRYRLEPECRTAKDH